MTVPSEQRPIRPNELWAALTIFFLPAAAAMLVEILRSIKMTDWAGQLMAIIFLGSAVVPLLWALIRGFPRWSPPYLGVVLVWFVIFVPFWRFVELIYPVLRSWIGSMPSWSLSVRILYQGMLTAIIWFLVLLSAFALVSLLRLWPHTRRLWNHIREDWTQFSFILYGGLVLYIAILFDDYQGDELWKVAAWLCLGFGCLFYLRAREEKQRLAFLLAGATLAMWTVALGKWLLVPAQNWGGGFARLPASDTDRYLEVGSAILNWVCLVIALLIPSVLKLFARKDQHVLQEDASLA